MRASVGSTPHLGREQEEPTAHVVVTGCGRSGTAFAARLLRDLGLRVGHEAVFGPHLQAFDGFGERDGDVSWLAAPFLRDLPPDVVIVHQVRDPLAVVRSFSGIRFFVDPGHPRLHADQAWAEAKWLARRAARALRLRSDTGPTARPFAAYRRFLDRWAPEVLAEPTPLDRALRYWLSWNDMIEAADRAPAAVRIEAAGPAHWSAVLDAAGRPASPATIEAALASTGTATNTRRRDEGVTWEAILARPLGSRVRERAAGYGYETP